MPDPAATPSPPCFVLVAGEASGDQLGAGLIEALRARFPQARFAGIGGQRMIAAGLVSWHPMQALSVMGLVEVLRHLPRLLAIRRDVVQRATALAPDVFIGIDAPDFNLGVERRLKQRGIRTVHYVSPSVWAWREQRAAKIGRSADRVLCLFPMEPAIYARHGVDARFVGHPMADEMIMQPDRAVARATLKLPADARLLAMLPGSRLGEIARLAPDFLEAARLLAARIPDLRVITPMANTACRKLFEQRLHEAHEADGGHGQLPPIDIVNGLAREAMIAADAVLLASGTATLEALLAKRPMVVAYRIAPLTHWIVKRLGLLKVNRYALPNVLAGRDLVPELMQHDCTPQALAQALLPLLQDDVAKCALHSDFERIHLQLRRDASNAAADAIAQLVKLA
ncbi:lipid-A-disaccharide synthase [Dokdonella sp.]|uniref:lipid-A-disaccharide synthase n=1 Tax=Dokdonella sp. TaxID=2291710 RepID=UPI0025C365A3|nr:lipid-A-disaccharide synthase [Dokdonella sp.]